MVFQCIDFGYGKVWMIVGIVLVSILVVVWFGLLIMVKKVLLCSISCLWVRLVLCRKVEVEVVFQCIDFGYGKVWMIVGIVLVSILVVVIFVVVVGCVGFGDHD